jgi:enterobacterial common antigen flippase
VPAELGVAPGAGASAVPARVAAISSSYGQILRSFVLIGGSAVLNISLGLIRTKAMAMILGPAGFGLMGAFTSIADLARSVVQLGINSSGVRQIAEAVSTQDEQRIARTATVLRRVAFLLALLGAALLVVFCKPIARLTFGDDSHAMAVALLSLAVAGRLLAESHGAMLQGMRRIKEMAKGTVLGAVLATLLSVPLVYWLREDGIVASLVVVAAASLAINWWYAHQVPLARVTVSLTDLRKESADLLRLGTAFMASGMLMMGAAYLVRIIVLRQEGLEAAGFFQAAWTMGGMYVGFVLQAMGADFYPRLVGVANDHAACNRLVNEQAEVSLLLAGPGVIATLVFSPWVLALAYSSEFSGAVDVLRWICVGIALRVISWPMGFILLAKNARLAFVGTELAWAVFNVGCTWWAVAQWGVAGAGIAFLASYVFHIVMIRWVVGRMTGFRWTRQNVWLMTVFVGLAAAVLWACLSLPTRAATGIGIAALVISALASAYGLSQLVPVEHLPRRLRRPVRGLRRVFDAKFKGRVAPSKG